MGKPPTREIAGLVWTYDGAVWCSGDHLIIRYEDDKGIVDYLATGPDDMFTRLADACEAEVRWAAKQDAVEAATKASPTLTPGELDRMLEGVTPADAPAVEHEAQRADTRAYYRNLAGWAVAALILVALCSGVVRG